MLAVWGSSGYGKSTVAVKLAKHLADKKISYLTIFTIIGMLKGENEYTYPPYSAVKASKLIGHLR